MEETNNQPVPNQPVASEQTVPPTPPVQEPTPVSPVSPESTKPKHKPLALQIIIFSVVVLGVGAFFAYKNGYVKLPTKEEPQIPVQTKCNVCTKENESTCQEGTSCFVPSGINTGYCVPTPKTGQVYTNEQINSLCGTSLPTSTPDPTADWETYTNYEYSFKYPKGLKSDTEAAGQGSESIRVTFVGPEQIASGRTQTELFDGYSFIVTKIDSNTTKTAQQQAQEDIKNSEEICESSTKSPLKEIKISDIGALQYSVDNGCMGDYTLSYLVRNGDLYSIAQSYSGNDTDKTKYKAITNQILSTFKFTSIEQEGVCPNGFKNYNDQYISVCYPENLKPMGFRLTNTEPKSYYIDFENLEKGIRLTINNNFTGGWGESCLKEYPTTMAEFKAKRIVIATKDKCNEILTITTITDGDISSSWAVSLMALNGQTFDVKSDFLPIETSLKIISEPQ